MKGEPYCCSFNLKRIALVPLCSHLASNSTGVHQIGSMKLFLSTSTRKPLKLFPGVSKALENNVYFIPSHLHLYCNMKI